MRQAFQPRQCRHCPRNGKRIDEQPKATVLTHGKALLSGGPIWGTVSPPASPETGLQHPSAWRKRYLDGRIAVRLHSRVRH